MNRWPRWGCDAGAVPLRGVWAGCSCLPLGWRNTDNHHWCRESRLCGSAHVVSTPNKTPPRGAFRRGGAETEPGRTPLLPVPRGSCEGDGSRKSIGGCHDTQTKGWNASYATEISDVATSKNNQLDHVLSSKKYFTTNHHKSILYLIWKCTQK